MPKRHRPREVIQVLEHLGWEVVRQRSNHVRLELSDGRNPVTVDVARRELPNNEFGSIIRQSGLSRAQFERAAEEVL